MAQEHPTARARIGFCSPRIAWAPDVDDLRAKWSELLRGAARGFGELARQRATLYSPQRMVPRWRAACAEGQYQVMRLPPNVEHEIHLYPRDHAAQVNAALERVLEPQWASAS